MLWMTLGLACALGASLKRRGDGSHRRLLFAPPLRPGGYRSTTAWLRGYAYLMSIGPYSAADMALMMFDNLGDVSSLGRLCYPHLRRGGHCISTKAAARHYQPYACGFP